MTPILSLRRRGRVLRRALWGMFVVAGIFLAGTPAAVAEPTTEAIDAINARYSAFGGQGSLLGIPVGDVVDVPGGAQRAYEGGAIFYSKDTGAHVMYGAILDRYLALGGPDGSTLGFPTNDESDTGDGIGRFNDFDTPGGASIYWGPEQGTSVLKGKVLEAWRLSGGITGPFGYPSADMSDVDGVLTAKFAGPEGTEIQWSQEGGLVTVPPNLAAGIPGFAADGATTTPSTPPTSEPTSSAAESGAAAPRAPSDGEKTGGKLPRWWWWIPVALVLLGVLGALVRRLSRGPKDAGVNADPLADVPEITEFTGPPDFAETPDFTGHPDFAGDPDFAGPPDFTGPQGGAAPPPPIPQPTQPVAPVNPPAPPGPPSPHPQAPPFQRVGNVVPPPASRPVGPPPSPPPVGPPPSPPPAGPPSPPPVGPPPPPHPLAGRAERPTPEVTERIRDEVAEAKANLRSGIADLPQVTVRTEPVESEAAPVIRYQSEPPTESSIQVTYQNNAVGEHQKSETDKSDLPAERPAE